MSGEELDAFKFQFTHPVRGATDDYLKGLERQMFQFTHPVRGATDLRQWRRGRNAVSIHAPREGCDISKATGAIPKLGFNSRTP